MYKVTQLGLNSGLVQTLCSQLLNYPAFLSNQRVYFNVQKLNIYTQFFLEHVYSEVHENIHPTANVQNMTPIHISQPILRLSQDQAFEKSSTYGKYGVLVVNFVH